MLRNKEPGMAYVALKYIHIVGIMALVSALVVEHLLIKPRMPPAEFRKLAMADLVYGVSATIIFMSGLALWFFAGKGSDFYIANPVFHAKVSIFMLVALLSIYPTVCFLKNRRVAAQEVFLPKSLGMIVRIELLMVLLLPLLAVLMAQGHGLA